MSKKEFKPYTYLIGWSILDKWYYGVQFNKKANPDNLWSTYFTSSKYVKEYRELYGEPDIIVVRRTFETKEKATQWEYNVIKRLNIVKNERWLNRSLLGQKFYKAKKVCIHCNILIDPGNYEQFHGDNCRLKPGNEDIKFFAPTKGMKFPNRKKVSEEGKINMRNAQLGKKQTEEHKNKIKNSMLGKNKIPRTEEQKINSSIKMKDVMKIKELCPYCNNYFNKSHIIQWHGNKCKQYKDKT